MSPEFRSSEQARWKNVQEKHGLRFEITRDRDEAVEIVEELIEAGEKLVITVPQQHYEHILKNGIPQIAQPDKSGLGLDYSVLAGRLGAEPYLNENEERWVIEVDPEGLDIQPRMTGRDHAFYGTVTVGGRIPASKIAVVGKFSGKTWKEHRDTEEGQSQAA